MATPSYVQTVCVTGGVEVKRAFVDADTLGANELVAAVAGKRICVLGLCASAKAAVDVTLKSGTTAISSLKGLTDSAGWTLSCPADPAMHWYQTEAGEALNVDVSAADKGVGVDVVYYEA
jgi:hypothetical protein